MAMASINTRPPGTNDDRRGWRRAHRPCATLCHVVTRERRQHISLRVPEHVYGRLETRARQIRETRSGLAERYLEEGLRMDEHPGIGFVDGPAGRRAVVLGTGLDVWEVIGTVKGSHGSIDTAARYLQVSPAQVRTAVRYYSDYDEEIDEWLERQEAAADRERQAAQRERELLR